MSSRICDDPFFIKLFCGAFLVISFSVGLLLPFINCVSQWEIGLYISNVYLHIVFEEKSVRLI